MNSGFDGERTSVRFEQLRSLNNIAQAISSKLHVEDILDAIPPVVKAITGSSDMNVALVIKTSDGFAIDRKNFKFTCPHPTQLVGKENRWKVAQKVMGTNEPMLVLPSGDLVSYDQYSDRLSPDISFAVLPLTSKNRSLGFLSVAAPVGEQFKHADIIFLTILASHIAVTIENVRLQEKIQELNLAKERSRLAEQILQVIMEGSACDRSQISNSPPFKPEDLTKKERQVLSLMARGCTNEQIANELWITLKTVKTHVSSILRKLGQKNRVQAIIYAIRKGLVEFTPD